MALPKRQLIAKAVFAVAVVASTASVGLVGFAQAARPQASSGYGTGIDQLLAAIDQFRHAVQQATNQYRSDVNACLAGTQSNLALRGEMARPDANGRFQNAQSTFNHHLDQTLDTLRSRVGDTKEAQGGKTKFQRNFQGATDDSFSQLNNAQDQLAADLAPINDQVTQGGLFQCLDTAQNKYRNALQTARAALLDAIRRIFG